MNYKINTKAELEDYIINHWNEVHAWIDQEQKKCPQLLTSSVDIRESALKYAPVDHNTYPAGFNNLCSRDLGRIGSLYKVYFQEKFPQVKIIGIIPESHTKNKFYLDHLFTLKQSLVSAGFQVYLISPDSNLFEENETELTLTSHSNHELRFYRVTLDTQVHFVNSQIKEKFDFILLNHDQSLPLNVDWGLLDIPVNPAPHMGWHRRQKIKHFTHYHKVVSNFSDFFSVNPLLMEAKFSYMDNINFNTKEGIEELSFKVDEFIKLLPENSKVFIKASQGTYGMGISVVSSGEEIKLMNRKIRNKMDVGKNNLKFTSVLIQESVETMIQYENAPAEVTIYLIDGQSAGGFIRANPLRGTQANLNAQGMIYRKFCISEIKQFNDYQIKEAVYCVIARLSCLAASHESLELIKELSHE